MIIDDDVYLYNNVALRNGGGCYLYTGREVKIDGSEAAHIYGNQAKLTGEWVRLEEIFESETYTPPKVVYDENRTDPIYEQYPDTQMGGAFYIMGTLRIINNESQIGDLTQAPNQARLGGGVYIAAGGTLTNRENNSSNTYYAGRFYNNVATESGGAVYNADGGTLTLGTAVVTVGSEQETLHTGFNFNQAKTGNGGAIYNAGTITQMEYVRLRGNQAGYQAANGEWIFTDNASLGGCIYSENALNASDIIIGDFEPKLPKRDADGKLEYVPNQDGTLTVLYEESQRVYNRARLGAGIYIGKGNSANIKNLIVQGCIASEDGGGLYNAGTTTLTGVVLLGGYVYANGKESIYRTDDTDGFSAHIYTDLVNPTPTGTPEEEKIILVSGNEAGRNGGAVFNAAGATFTVPNTAQTANNQAENGGGLYNSGTFIVSVVDANQKILFYNNEATNDGGAIYAAVDMTLDGYMFANNRADSDYNKDGDGGAVFTEQNLTVTNTLVRNLDMTMVWDVKNDETSTEVVSGNRSVKELGAGANNGGAFYLGGAGKTANLTNVAIYDCVAETSGGAIYVSDGVTLNLNSGCVIGGNPTDGGSDYSTSSYTAKTVYAQDNLSKNEYGEVVKKTIYENYTANSTITLKYRNSTGNTAENGGGIYNTGTVHVAENTTIAANRATNGGGLYLDGLLTVADGKVLTVSGNNVAMATLNNGGGIYIGANAQYGSTAGEVTLTAASLSKLSISGNGTAANTDGGAFYNAGKVNVDARGGAVVFNSQNEASQGAAFYTVGTFGVDVTNYNGYSVNGLNGPSSKTFKFTITNQTGGSAFAVGKIDGVTSEATLANTKIHGNTGDGVLVEGGYLQLTKGSEIGVDMYNGVIRTYDGGATYTANTGNGLVVTAGVVDIPSADSTAAYLVNGTTANVKDTVMISGNGGNGVVISGGNVYINDTHMEANTGSGLVISGGQSGDNVYLSNSLVADNTGKGVEIASGAAENIVLTNSTLAGNTGATAQLINSSIKSVRLNNMVAPSASGNFQYGGGGLTQTGAAATFMFQTNALGNKYTLTNTNTVVSPAIDAGENAQALYYTSANRTGTAIDKDLAAHDRIFNNIVDLGAYEYPEIVISTVNGFGWLDDVKFATEWVLTDYQGYFRFDISANNTTFIWYQWDPDTGTVGGEGMNGLKDKYKDIPRPIMIHQTQATSDKDYGYETPSQIQVGYTFNSAREVNVDGRYYVEANNKYYWMNITLDSENCCGLFFVCNSNITFNLYGVTLKNGYNPSQDFGGGAICCSTASTVNLYSVSVVNCTAFRGGAIYMNAGGKLNIYTPTTVETGGADGTLGTTARYNVNGKITDNRGSWVNRQWVASDVPNPSPNMANEIGGKIKLSVFEGNQANYGGAIYTESSTDPLAIQGVDLAGYGLADADQNVKYAMVDGTPVIRQYSVQFIDNETTDSYGGAIYTNSGTTINGASFIGNYQYEGISSIYGGGAIFSWNTLNLCNIDFLCNSADTTGGALCVGSGAATITGNVVFAGNQITKRNAATANNGGAIYVGGSATLTIGDVLATSNGRYLFADGNLNTIGGYSTEILCNEAANGGAIFLEGGSKLEMNKVLIERNIAETGSGGGIYAQGAGKTALTNVDFVQNYSNYIGGGAYFQNANVSMTDCKFTSNWAVNNGGAYYTTAAITGAPTFNANYSRNTAKVSPVYDTYLYRTNQTDVTYEGQRLDKKEYRIADGWESYVGKSGITQGYNGSAMAKQVEATAAPGASSGFSIQFEEAIDFPTLIANGTIVDAVQIVASSAAGEVQVVLSADQFRFDSETNTLSVNLKQAENLVSGTTYSLSVVFDSETIGSPVYLSNETSLDWINTSGPSCLVWNPTAEDVSEMPDSIAELTEWSYFWLELWSESGLQSGVHTVAYNANLFDLSETSYDVPAGVTVSFGEKTVNETTGLTEVEVTVTVQAGYVTNTGTRRLVSLRMTPALSGGFDSALDSANGTILTNGDSVGETVSAVSYDMNRDGVVNMPDFIEFAKMFNQTAEADRPLSADYDGSGVVDMADFILFAQNFNKKKADENVSLILANKKTETAASEQIVESITAVEAAPVAAEESAVVAEAAPVVAEESAVEIAAAHWLAESGQMVRAEAEPINREALLDLFSRQLNESGAAVDSALVVDSAAIDELLSGDSEDPLLESKASEDDLSADDLLTNDLYADPLAIQWTIENWQGNRNE